MFDFLIAHLADIIVGTLVFTALTASVLKMLRDKKSGKSSCSCSCAGCSGAAKCGNKK